MERYKIKSFEIIFVKGYVIVKTNLQTNILTVHTSNHKMFISRVHKAVKEGEIEDMADLFKLFWKKSGDKEQVIFMQPFNPVYYPWGKDI